MDDFNLTEEELALLIGQSPGGRNRLEEQRRVGAALRGGAKDLGMLQGRAGGPMVSSGLGGLASNLLNRYQGMKQEKKSTTGLEDMENKDFERQQMIARIMQGKHASQPVGPAQGPVNIQAGQLDLPQQAPINFGAPQAGGGAPQGAPPPGGAGLQAGPGQAPPVMSPQMAAASPNQRGLMNDVPGMDAMPTQATRPGSPGMLAGANATSAKKEFEMLPFAERNKWIAQGYNPQTGEGSPHGR